MREFFRNILTEEEWLIEENGFRQKGQGNREAQFALGNGYLGSRGILEELPYDSSPGTYIAGVFDNTGAIATEIVNAPNPIFFRITSRGEKVDPIAMDILEHNHTLDMQKGILFRKTIFSNHKKQRFDYQSMRFFSMHDKHLGVMQVYFTSLDAATDITVQTTVDTSVTNTGMLTEGRKRHFQVTEVSKPKNLHYLCVETFEKKILLSYASKLIVERNGKRVATPKRVLRFKIKKGETISFTKIFSIYTSLDVSPKRLKSITIDSTRKFVQLGFDKALNRHIGSWREKWRPANVTIEGDLEAQKALRFNIYHMLICGDKGNGKASIGARTLSGEGYRGHVFWDFEIFNLPFFIYTDPEIAKHLLLYRYKRLDKAREIAASKGYKGAMFPWESADTGEETTPAWSKGLDGSVIEIHTMEMECHLTADIAYAINHYYTASGDYEFMMEYGLEIMLEAARFWASRVEYNKKKRRYEIKCVIGPDEFHECVDNNAYTNIMAKWNLLRAIELYRRFCKRYPGKVHRLSKKLQLNNRELVNWKNIAARLITHIYKKKNIIEAFDGYFDLKDTPITKMDENFMPTFPKGITPRNVHKTQLVKQADVVMLLYLFSDIFHGTIKRKSYSYYARRTMHKSSLSPSTHAIVGSDTGDPKAYRYFLTSLYADLNDNHGNAHNGIHAASLGGTWQAAINGFAGVGIKQGILSFNPNLPAEWQGVSFSLKWKGYTISISTFKKSMEIYYESKKKKDKLRLRIYNILREVPANKKLSFIKA